MIPTVFHNKNGSHIARPSLKQPVCIEAEKIIAMIDFNLAQFCL